MTTLTNRLLELNRLHAGAIQYKSAAGDHNHLAAANRALFKAWPDIYREITRLTSEVERLERKHERANRQKVRLRVNADALAEAVADTPFEYVEMPNHDFGVYVVDSPDWQNIREKAAALTAFKEGN